MLLQTMYKCRSKVSYLQLVHQSAALLRIMSHRPLRNHKLAQAPAIKINLRARMNNHPACKLRHKTMESCHYKPRWTQPRENHLTTLILKLSSLTAAMLMIATSGTTKRKMSSQGNMLTKSPLETKVIDRIKGNRHLFKTR